MSEPLQGHHVARDFPAPIRGLAAASRALAAVEGVGIALSMAMLIVIATWQFAARNVRMKIIPALDPAHAWIGGLLGKFPHEPEWSDNVLRHAVFLTGFLGAMFASYTARHLRIDALTRLAPPRPRLALRVASTFGAIVIGSLIIWASLKSALPPTKVPFPC